MSVTLSGTITAAGSPVSGATVGPYSAATGLLVGSADTTDGDGAYSLSLAAGVYKLRLYKSGYPVAWYGSSTFTGAAEITLVSATVTVNMALYPAPASGFSLGDLALWVDGWSGFAVQSFVSRIRLLSDGISTNNEAVQSGAVPRKSGKLSLPWLDDADQLALRTAFEAVSQLVCITPAETLTVYIEDYAATWLEPDLWTADLTLVEVL